MAKKNGDWLTDVAGFTDQERALWELMGRSDQYSSPWISSQWTCDMQDIVDTQRSCASKLIAVLNDPD